MRNRCACRQSGDLRGAPTGTRLFVSTRQARVSGASSRGVRAVSPGTRSVCSSVRGRGSSASPVFSSGQGCCLFGARAAGYWPCPPPVQQPRACLCHWPISRCPMSSLHKLPTIHVEWLHFPNLTSGEAWASAGGRGVSLVQCKSSKNDT